MDLSAPPASRRRATGRRPIPTRHRPVASRFQRSTVSPLAPAAPGLLALSLAAGLAPPAAAAQAPTRDSYYESLPSPSSIIAQTEATQLFRLFGDTLDPSYLDRAPRDGVDDRRAGRLLELAERFSPILRRNTYLVPLEFEDALHENVRIYVDAWRDHLRVDSGLVELGPRITGRNGFTAKARRKGGARRQGFRGHHPFHPVR